MIAALESTVKYQYHSNIRVYIGRQKNIFEKVDVELLTCINHDHNVRNELITLLADFSFVQEQ